MIHLTFHLIYYLGDVESSVEEIFFNWHYTWLDRLKGEFARWKDNNKNNFLGKIIRSSRSLYLDLDQCGQIWRNFTVLVTFYKPLAYLLRVYLVFDKFLNLLWQFFTLLWPSGKKTIAANGFFLLNLTWPISGLEVNLKDVTGNNYIRLQPATISPSLLEIKTREHTHSLT